MSDIMSYYGTLRREEVAPPAEPEAEAELETEGSYFVWLPRGNEAAKGHDAACGEEHLRPCDACGRPIDLTDGAWSGSEDGHIFCARCVATWGLEAADAAA